MSETSERTLSEPILGLLDMTTRGWASSVSSQQCHRYGRMPTKQLWILTPLTGTSNYSRGLDLLFFSFLFFFTFSSMPIVGGAGVLSLNCGRLRCGSLKCMMLPRNGSSSVCPGTGMGLLFHKKTR